MNDQRSLTTQIDTLIALANEKGLYDAADHILAIKIDRDNAVRMSNAADADRVRLNEENVNLKTGESSCGYCGKPREGLCSYCWHRQIHSLRTSASKAFHDPGRYPSLPWIEKCIRTLSSWLEPLPPPIFPAKEDSSD